MKEVDPQHKLSIYAQLEEHIEAIQHFDVLQCLLRKIGITLLMGSFAAIGFLFSIKPQVLPFSSITICIFVCLFSILMVIIISIMDLVFIDRLLMSAFFDALRLEHENPWLFPIHSRMLNSSKEHHGSLSKKVKFYIGYSKDLLFLLFVCITLLIGLEEWKWILFLVVPLGILTIYFYGKLFKLMARRSEKRIQQNFEKMWGKKDKWTMT